MYAPDHRRKEARDVMYRSNSSLDLIYSDQPSGNGLRREYGSHGSIDVIGGGCERLPAMVHNYSVVSTSDKPPGLARATDRLTDVLSSDHADGPQPRTSASPKPRLKLNKLWGGQTPSNISRQTLDDGAISALTECAKRKQFAHYDCQSLMANLSYAAEIRGALLSRRRNTTTGASAASLLATKGLPPGEDAVPDTGDGRSNELLESCPFFRNELGGKCNYLNKFPNVFYSTLHLHPLHTNPNCVCCSQTHHCKSEWAYVSQVFKTTFKHNLSCNCRLAISNDFQMLFTVMCNFECVVLHHYSLSGFK